MCTKPQNCAKTKDLSEPRMKGEEKDTLVVAVERTREYARSWAEACAVILWEALDVMRKISASCMVVSDSTPQYLRILLFHLALCQY